MVRNPPYPSLNQAMSTELSGQRYILVRGSTPRSQLKQPEFLVAAVKRANETYKVVTKQEEKQFCDFYDQQLQAGVDVAVVEKMITDHIENMRNMFVQAKQLLVRLLRRIGDSVRSGLIMLGIRSRGWDRSRSRHRQVGGRSGRRRGRRP
ncbi:hypothetical protein B0H10DRAFT_1214599 [Mycena sp. CBHHK59/15]|nr:hypothetical protein B0H10DRAFT_1214599 [Mycena sp. CBHHK59/15]